MRKHLKLVISLLLTGAIMVALYSMVDMEAMGRVLAGSDPIWLGAYLLFFVPQLLVAGWRWQQIVRHFGGTRQSFSLSFSQNLGAYAANLIIPSKFGEFVKGAWLDIGDRKFLPYFLVVLEKLLDVLATLGILTVALVFVIPAPEFQPLSVLLPILGGLLLCWAIGLTLLRTPWPVRIVNRYLLKKDEATVQAQWRSVVSKRGSLVHVGWISIVLWMLQLLQFTCMFMMFDVYVPLDELFVGAPIGLLAGALPLTAGGIGLRDAALLWYYGSIINMEIVLAVGILSFLRILLVGLAALPFFFVRMKEVGNGK